MGIYRNLSTLHVLTLRGVPSRRFRRGTWTEGPVKMHIVWPLPCLSATYKRTRTGTRSRVGWPIWFCNWVQSGPVRSGGGGNTYFTFVIDYHLTVMLCLDSTIPKLECILLRFLWKGNVPMICQSVCCQYPVKESRNAMVNDVQTSAETTASLHPQLVWMTELQSWIRKTPAGEPNGTASVTLL